MNRRKFFRALAGAPFAIKALLNVEIPATAQGLAFSKDAFNIGAAELPLPITLVRSYDVDLEFSNDDLILTMEEFKDRYIDPAVVNYFDSVFPDRPLMPQTDAVFDDTELLIAEAVESPASAISKFIAHPGRPGYSGPHRPGSWLWYLDHWTSGPPEE